MPGTLYLIPNLLGEAPMEASLPAQVPALVRTLNHFLVEDAKSARKFLKLCGSLPPYDHIVFHTLDKHTSFQERIAILKELGDNDAGILSDAGCPAVADPGADIIVMAAEGGWKIKPLVGPSSILLAIMASGFNGQAFSFHGYLPVPPPERTGKIRQLETDSANNGYSQIFIETPYRNDALFQDIINTCKAETLLSIACDLTLDTEEVATYAIQKWKNKVPNLRSRPTVFSIWVPILQKRAAKPKYERQDRNFDR